jgi:hypothetical protein
MVEVICDIGMGSKVDTRWQNPYKRRDVGITHSAERMAHSVFFLFTLGAMLFALSSNVSQHIFQ